MTRTRKICVQRDGFNKTALLAGPFWYLSRGVTGKGIALLLVALFSLGILAIPVWIYCGYNGNKDFYRYLKRKNIYIHSSYEPSEVNEQEDTAY